MRIFVVLLIVFLSGNSCSSEAQTVNGRVLKSDKYLKVVKVWGTHAERGFAYGFLLGEDIRILYDGYIRPAFGQKLDSAKDQIKSGAFSIPEKYIVEAKAVIEGMRAGAADVTNFDYIDLLLANSFLDFEGIAQNGCSSLISWGDATDNSSLKRATSVTRFMDWDSFSVLQNHNLILVQIPSEPDEQPWLMIGYPGQLGVLSGVNQSGLFVFQHILFDDFVYPGDKPIYEPVWFSLRRAIEDKDPDGNGQNDVNDVRKVLSENDSGYANGFIVATGSSFCETDSLAAMVAELAPDKPFLTFRTSNYDDEINGRNLFAANSPIARNDARSYCMRYFKVFKNISDSTNFTAESQYALMCEKAKADGNMQVMQIIPQQNILKFAFMKKGRPAYMNRAKTFKLNKLFENPLE